MIEIGKLNTLTVKRKSDLGYMLTDGVDEILMHFKESKKELNDNESVTVYVYTDKENRKTAKVIHGFLSWMDGQIDIATETLYLESYTYTKDVSA